MKLLFAILSLSFSLSYFQFPAEDNLVIKKADRMEYNATSGLQVMEGNVSLTTDYLKIKNADKVTFNKETDEIIVYGTYSVEFKEKLVSDSTLDKGVLKYTLGEKVAYMGHKGDK
ncbi:hypothetical protein [Algoriphagus vanfongensis]|uniref:hypothetical protein n=1 Tax=Algoriphagus vanfongensis TaxID=426371 RepID=UPI0004115DD9|nr:hypothetical protein [Algoriphagus vanfongensis]